jgi:hypothetical protein
MITCIKRALAKIKKYKTQFLNNWTLTNEIEKNNKIKNNRKSYSNQPKLAS